MSGERCGAWVFCFVRMHYYYQVHMSFILHSSFLGHRSRGLKWAFLIKICPLSVVVVVVVGVVFLAHLNWKLYRAFLIAYRLFVCLSFCPSVCKLILFSTSSQEPLVQFQPNLAQIIIGKRGFKFVQLKSSVLFQVEIVTK